MNFSWDSDGRAYRTYYDLEEDINLKLHEYDPIPQGTVSSGGPSSYYDMPFSTFKTTNCQMEYLAENKWGKYGIHLKDIFKGLCRWGDKAGTNSVYDSKKVIYYGTRVLMMLVGVNETREYLQELLDDQQFEESE
tara:strand:+ start:484 stop:888 length:405 start_codon:yes stop_codon:yes gene_type:complete